METEDLVRAAKRGNEDAFYQLIKPHKEKMYRMAFVYFKNEQDALEAVQEAVCRAFSNIKRLKEPRYFSTWIIRILINTCMDELRRRQNEQTLDIRVETAEAPKWDERLTVQMAVDELDPKHKQVVILKYFEDMTLKEISELLDHPLGTVKTWLHQSLQQLKQILGTKG